MAGLFGKKHSSSSNTTATNLRVQSSVQGRARAIGAGQNRLSGDIIWYSDFKASNSSGHGKGGAVSGSGKGSTGTTNYSASFIVAVGEGPISAYNTVYNANAIDFLTTPSAQVLADLQTLGITPTYGNTYGATYQLGSYAQSAWSFLTSNHAAQALSYRGLPTACFPNLNLGSSSSLPNFSFEVTWGLNSDIPSLSLDANPADWVVQFLSNTDWGAGFPAALIGDVSAYRTWARATGMLVSPVVADQTAANSHLKDIMQGTVADFRWSSGLLTIVPYGDANVTGNGYTYAAAVTPIYDLTINDCLPIQGGKSNSNVDTPIETQRKDPATVLNKVQVEYLDRSNIYNPAVIYDQDDASIVAAGRTRQSDLRGHHFFCLASAASMSASLQLRREKVLATYVFTLPPQFILLDTLDIVTLTEVNLGLSKQPVRIVEIQENDDYSLTFTAEEFLGTVTAPLYPRQASSGTAFNYNQDPGSVNTPILFEPTAAQDGGTLEIWGAVSGANMSIWGGCNIWVCGTPDGTYEQVGTLTGASRHGVLTAALPTYKQSILGQTIDNTNTLSVDLTMSHGALSSGSTADMTGLNTACYVDGEIISYTTASLTGSYQYSLSPLVRGAYGSPISAHAAGSKFTRLDAQIFTDTFTQDRIGSVLYFKFASFNIYGGGLQDLSTISPYAYTIQGTAVSAALANVANLHVTTESGINKLYWDEITTDIRIAIRYKIKSGTSYDAGVEVADVAHAGATIPSDGTYWVTAYCQPSPGLIVYSAAPQSIVVSSTTSTNNGVNTLLSFDKSASGWSGTLTNLNKIGIDPNAIVELGAFGIFDILSIADYLNTSDIYAAGATTTPGYYTVPASEIVDAKRVATMTVALQWAGFGIQTNVNILTIADYLNYADVLGTASNPQAIVTPQINLDTSPGATGFNGWQNFAPGTYTARRLNFRLLCSTTDTAILAAASTFKGKIYIPSRSDHYQALAVLAAGQTITFQPDGSATAAAFNAGPGGVALPYASVNFQGSSGDYYVITGLSLSQLTITFYNSSGTAVARTANITVEGY